MEQGFTFIPMDKAKIVITILCVLCFIVCFACCEVCVRVSSNQINSGVVMFLYIICNVVGILYRIIIFGHVLVN